MAKSEISPWVGPAVGVFCLAFSVVCGWWQVRRDNQIIRSTGEFPRREDTWGDVIFLFGSGALFVAALTMLKENREGGARPVAAILFALGALVCQAFLARKIKGRIEMGVAIFGGAVMSVIAIVFAIVKVLK